MLQPNSKPKWWLPIMMLFVPGSCYWYAAVFPNFRMDFAIIGVLITAANVLLATWRVVAPRQTDTHIFRSFAVQGFTLAILLISCQFWLAFSPVLPILTIIILFLVYILAWFFPFIWPSTAQMLYRELWFPKSKLIRFLVAIGGGVGVLGATMGKYLAKFGNSGLLIMAILATMTLIAGTFYISSYLWRQKQDMNPMPSAED